MYLLNGYTQLKLVFLIRGNKSGIRCVAVKCLDMTRNSYCEGSFAGSLLTLMLEGAGIKQIRYPKSSPHSKLWILVGDILSVAAKALSIPCGTFARMKLKGIDGARTRRNMWFNPDDTRGTYPLELLMFYLETDTLLQASEGAAWLSSARAVRCLAMP